MLVLVIVVVLMLMLVLVLALTLALLLLLLLLLALFLLIWRARVHCLISNRYNIIEEQHTCWGWLTEPQAVELLFPSFGQVLATAGCTHADNNGDKAKDKSGTDDQTTEEGLVT